MSTKEFGQPAVSNRDKWVQTERKAHEAWAAMIVAAPMAAAVMHKLVALMDRQNAVVISQKTLAKVLGIHVNTVKTAINKLEADDWLEVIQIGPRGTVNAYRINDQVAWADSRENLKLSAFSASIIASADEQSVQTMSRRSLRRVPVLFSGEQQLPVGEGLPPPSQPAFPGMEPPLPAQQLSDPPLTPSGELRKGPRFQRVPEG